MPPLMPFCVFLLCVVALFLISGKIAFERNWVSVPERPSIKLPLCDTDTLFKKIVVWSCVGLGGIAFCMLELYVVFLLLKTGDLFRYGVACITGFLLYEFAGYLFSSRVAKVLLAFVVSLLWLLWPNWLTLDIAGACIVIVFLVNIRSISFRSATIISGIVIVYDVVSVFGTGVMQKVAMGILGSVPMLFVVPKHLTLASERAFALGLGDVVVPGILIMIALREAKNYATPKIGWSAILGYVCGGILTYSILFIFKTGQPATLYLIPATFFALLWGAWNTQVKNILLGEINLAPPVLPSGGRQEGFASCP